MSGNARSAWMANNPSTTNMAEGEAISQNRCASTSINRPVMAMPPQNTYTNNGSRSTIAEAR